MFSFFFLTYWLENLLVRNLYFSPFTYVCNCHLLLIIAFFKNLRSYTPLCNSTFLCICPSSEENFLCPEARGSSLSLPSLKILSFYSSINLSLFLPLIFFKCKNGKVLEFLWNFKVQKARQSPAISLSSRKRKRN